MPTQTELDQETAQANAILSEDAGVWDAETEIRTGPGEPPMRQKAMSTNRMVGGRWLTMDYKADSGFEGHGLYGWDAAKRKYTGIWVDSMQTAMARGEGTWNPAARTATYEFTTTHGDKPARYRETIERPDRDTRIYRNFVAAPDGKEFEMIHVVYKRRK